VSVPVWAWAAFAAFVIAMLALDLFVLHRRAQEVSLRPAGPLDQSLRPGLRRGAG
jgi:hypothetical protein